MKKNFSKKKSAFSLIELSIVLIIIGLLIAGITGGASLIKSSELRAAMSEARGYAVAVNAFFTQFNSLPGDYNVTVGGVSGAAGDADNQIEYFSGATLSATVTHSEAAAAWIHLRYAAVIDNLPGTIALINESTTAPTFGTSSVAGSNAPSSRTRNNGWTFDYRTLTEGNNTAANQNVVVLTGNPLTGATTVNTLVNGTNVAAASLIGSDALSIDAKIDDGVANLGRIRGLNPVSTTGCYLAASNAAATYITTSATSKVCALTYQVDVNS